MVIEQDTVLEFDLFGFEIKEIESRISFILFISFVNDSISFLSSELINFFLVISSRYTVNIFVEEGAILVKFATACEEEISANLGMSFAAGLKRAGRMLTSFCSMLLATILTVLTVAVLVVTT